MRFPLLHLVRNAMPRCPSGLRERIVIRGAAHVVGSTPTLGSFWLWAECSGYLGDFSLRVAGGSNPHRALYLAYNTPASGGTGIHTCLRNRRSRSMRVQLAPRGNTIAFAGRSVGLSVERRRKPEVVGPNPTVSQDTVAQSCRPATYPQSNFETFRNGPIVSGYHLQHDPVAGSSPARS
jgi:hypothetical protein